MRCLGFGLARGLWCTVLGGAVATLGPGGTAWVSAMDPGPAPPAAMDVVDEHADYPGPCWDLEAYGPIAEKTCPYAADYSDDGCYRDDYSYSHNDGYDYEYVTPADQYGSGEAAEETSLEFDEPRETPETVTTEVEAVEEVAGDSSEWLYEDEYSYEYDGYGEMGAETTEVADESSATDAEAVEEEADDFSYEDEYSYEYDGYGEMDAETAEVADEAAATDAEAVEDAADDFSYEDEYSYEYDGYGEMGAETAEVADESAATDAEAVEDAADDYSCEDEYSYEYDGYGEMGGEVAEVADESAAIDAEAVEEVADDSSEWKYEDEYSYEDASYESMYGYRYDDGEAMETVQTVEEAQPVDESVRAVETPEYDDETMDGQYGDESFADVESPVDSQSAAVEDESDYYDYEMMYTPLDSDETEAAAEDFETPQSDSGEAEMDDSAGVSQPNDAYDWTYQYGGRYGYEYAADEESFEDASSQAAPAETAVEIIEDNSGLEVPSDCEPVESAEPYGYADMLDETDSFGNGVPEVPAYDGSMNEFSSEETEAEEASDGVVEYESWNGYRYEYYYQANEVSDTAVEAVDAAVETETDETSQPAAVEPSCSTEDETTRYDYADPYAYYGEAFEGGAQQQWQADGGADATAPAEVGEESGIELFGWTPAELLTWSDQQLLRTLETLCEEPASVRRATLNDYLTSLGTEALEFASQFEDTTGIEVAGLAEDLPGAAALLATYRLIERGEVGTSEGVDLLRRSLHDLSPSWIEGVRAMTADAFENRDDPCDLMSAVDASPVSNGDELSPVVSAMISLATNSLAGVGAAVLDFSQAVVGVDWETLVLRNTEDQAASLGGVDSDSYQR